MEKVNGNTKEKSTALAIALSVLWTGAGHLYVGKEEKGAILLIVYFGLAVFSVLTGGIFLIALFPFWIWGIFDANKMADAHNDRLRKADDEQQVEQEEIEKQATSTADFVTHLEKISKLHAASFLTEEEYQTQKKDLILSLLDKKLQDDPIDFFTALIPSIEKGYLSEAEISQIKKFVE